MQIRNEFLEKVLLFLKEEKEDILYNETIKLYNLSKKRIEKLLKDYFMNIENKYYYKVKVEHHLDDFIQYKIYEKRQNQDNAGGSCIDFNNKLSLLDRKKEDTENTEGVFSKKMQIIYMNDTYYMASYGANAKIRNGYMNGLTSYNILESMCASILITQEEINALKKIYNNKAGQSITNRYLHHVLSEATMDNVLLYNIDYTMIDNIRFVRAALNIKNDDMFSDDSHDRYVRKIFDLLSVNQFSFLALRPEDMFNIILIRIKNGKLSDEQLKLFVADNYYKHINFDAGSERYYVNKYVGLDSQDMIDLSFIVAFQQSLKAYLLDSNKAKAIMLDNKYDKISNINVEATNKEGVIYKCKAPIKDILNDAYVFRLVNDKGDTEYLYNHKIYEYDIDLSFRGFVANDNYKSIAEKTLLDNEFIMYKVKNDKGSMTRLVDSIDAVDKETIDRYGVQGFLIKKPNRALYSTRKTIKYEEMKKIILILNKKEAIYAPEDILNQYSLTKSDLEILNLIKKHRDTNYRYSFMRVLGETIYEVLKTYYIDMNDAIHVFEGFIKEI